MEKFGRFPYITLVIFSSYFAGASIGREALKDHSQIYKKAYKCSIRAVAIKLFLCMVA